MFGGNPRGGSVHGASNVNNQDGPKGLGPIEGTFFEGRGAPSPRASPRFAGTSRQCPVCSECEQPGLSDVL